MQGHFCLLEAESLEPKGGHTLLKIEAVWVPDKISLRQGMCLYVQNKKQHSDS
jgi:hypothetical protein